MRIYQPMLFVGLGGTGCQVGAELERRLRDELCGADGTQLQELMTGKNFLPYQLPSNLQFVYADLNEDEYGRLERRVVPQPEHLPAAERTFQLVRDLVPQYETYPEVARSLRLNSNPYVESWLPEPDGEPRVGPLVKGAGQLPTVGRAALFETFRYGVTPAQGPIYKAIGAINNSAGELSLLGGKLRGSCDVFVAFSVAGGTGSGLFYDYLHLIGDAMARSGYRARVYPLVLMPSAFEEGLGGGRRARLNAGRALLDLFRLVDDQNTQAAGTQLDDFGVTGALSVRYPGHGEIRLRASTVPTAFLFSRSAGVNREDLHRSVVSLILSLVGTDLAAEQDGVVQPNATYQSFADDFINSAVERETPAPTAIGSRGVSTSLVASMTVPVDDLADTVGSRLLAEAVAELSEPPPGRAESNREQIEMFFTASNLDPLRLRAPLELHGPAAVQGADAIQQALSTRLRTMEAGLDTLDQQLRQRVPELTQSFDPHRAAEQLLREVDLFRLRRILLGHSALAEEVDRLGFAKIVESRRREPAPPAGIALSPPSAKGIQNRMFAKLRWTDQAVRNALRQQEVWYSWRAKRAWHAAWNEQATRWEGRLRQLERQVDGLTEAFLEHARMDAARFTARARELYQPRVGVSYLLPPQGKDLEPFYHAVLRRFVDFYVAQGRLRPTATASDVMTEILGDDGWRNAYRIAWRQQNPQQAVAHVRDTVKRAVKRLFAYHDGEHRPLLPALQDLLAAACGRQVAAVDNDDLGQFRQKLAGLVPGGFSPSGNGPMKVLFSYPASAKDPELEKFLYQEVNLPWGADSVVEFRPTGAESIVVVLFRTSMGITEVPEVREVLRHWAGALRNEQPQDFVRWRQRVGYDFGYLASTPEHRVLILHRLLCAIWNGYVHVTGEPDSPRAIQVRLGGSRVAMRLQLESYGGRSSWGNVLSAYEEWVLADDEQIRRDFCERLMSVVPEGLNASPCAAAPLYQTLMDLASTQPKEINASLAQRPGTSSPRLEMLREFWADTFPAALELPFRGVLNPIEVNLRELAGWMQR